MSQHWENRFSNTFVNRRQQIILEIGKDIFTREELASKLHCVETKAASSLSVALQQFRPKSIEDLARRITPADFFDINGIGETAMWVFMSALEYAGVDSQKWLDTDQKVPSLYQRALRDRSSARRRRLRRVA